MNRTEQQLKDASFEHFDNLSNEDCNACGAAHWKGFEAGYALGQSDSGADELATALEAIATEHEHQDECWRGDELADDGAGHADYHRKWGEFARAALAKYRKGK